MTKIVLILSTLVSLFATVSAENPTRYQWLPPFKFDGGINIMSDKGQLEANQIYDARDFIWLDNQLQVREGFYRYIEPLSGNGVKFIDVFRNTGGEAYLLYSDGANLWYRSALTSPSVELNIGRSNAGQVNTLGTVVTGDSVLVQKWRSAFGTGEGNTVTIDGTDYTVNKIILDTLLYLTSTAGTTTDKAYNMDYAAVTVNDGLVMSDNYWVYTNTGKFRFTHADSFVVVDSLSGLRSQYTTVGRKFSSGYPVLYWSEVSQSISQDYAGKFLRVTTNPKSAGTPANPITGTHPFYMSYPVRTSSIYGTATTYGAAFQPDSTTDQYFTIEDLAYDSTTRTVYTVDSVRLMVQDSATYNYLGAAGALYLAIYDADFDSSTFITGDWFFYPRYNFTISGLYDSAGSDAGSYLVLPKTANTVFPVVGGFKSTDGAIYVAWPAIWNGISRNQVDVNENNCKITMYRMKKDIAGERSAGLRFAEVFQDRVFTARDTTCNQLEWSEPFEPDNSISTSVMIINSGDGECITAAKQQYADLIVYMPDSRWKIFGDGTNAGYGKERMNGHVGCVARGSLLSIDNNHYFLHSTGYYVSNGDAPQLISSAVNGYFTDSLSADEYDEIVSGYDQERGNIWISWPSITLVYNIATGSWWRQSINAGAYYYNPDIEVSDSVRFMIGATDSSTILVRGHAKDDGANIDAYFRTGFLDFGSYDNYKRLEKFHLRHDVVSTCDSIVQATYVDTVVTPLPSISYVPRSAWSDRKVTLRDDVQVGERLSLKWTLYDAGMTKLPHISIRLWLGGEVE